MGSSSKSQEYQLPLTDLSSAEQCSSQGMLSIMTTTGDTRERKAVIQWMDGMDGIFGYLTLHEAYCLCVGNRSGHNLHTRG